MKATIERMMLLSGIPAALRQRRRPDVLILSYHNIVPHGEPTCGDRSLHLSQRAFADQLDALVATHDVVPLASALREAPHGRPRAVITFDDGYRGAMTAGVEELRRRGLPATVFVVPSFVGRGPFWWDLLTAPGAGALDPALREHALWALAGRHDRVLAWAHERGIKQQEPMEHACAASERELEQATRTAELTLASHSWSHANLAALAPAELDAELRLALEWIDARPARTLRALAYPYGLSTPKVEQAAAAAGHEAALRVDGGWLRPDARAPFAIPRLNVPAGISTNGFRLRGAGLFCR